MFHFDPPATEEEVRAASLQFVRKISGYHKPSKLNQSEFDRAVNDIAAVSMRLIRELKTDSPPRIRENSERSPALTRF